MRTSRLLTGCAIGAVLAAMAAPTAAQSFVGTPTVVAGSALVTPGPGTTDIVLRLPETVINWQVDDPASTGLVNFQPGGIATFSEDPALQDYTVLNRILPVDGSGNPINSVVSFNGTVQGLLKGFPGGHIWFYSPAGIIAGPTAVFNVGSLILTTNDIPFNPALPNPIYGPGGLVQLLGPAGSTGYIEVQPGAQLSATGPNAYLALVAPRVIQGGTAQANGPIAYLAAEQVDMTINGGLFDFILTVGTDDANGIVHTGTTTGPASISAGDQQRISMVALPKNIALTMLLSGSIGYTPAAIAINEGSSIVLAAGFDTDDPTGLPGNALGSIGIANASFANALTGFASDSLGIKPAAGTTAFLADAKLYGLNAASITAAGSTLVVATGNLALHAGTPGTGGTIDMVALSKGQINVGGILVADASSSAAQFVAAPANLDATGGTIAITADDGTIAALNLVAGAEATGRFGDSRGGNGTGGTVNVTVTNGGTLTVGALNLSANALGGPSARSGGDGTGGTANLTFDSGSLNAATVFIESNGGGGTGSSSQVADPYQSGHGSGGTSGFTQNGGTANVTTFTLQSDGFGGGPAEAAAAGTDLATLAGNGTGGSALLQMSGGELTTTDTTIQALGIGADGMDHAGAGGVASDGGIGTGGSAAFQSTGTFSTTTLTMLANGQGGDGGNAAAGTNGNGGSGAGFSAAADLADGPFGLGTVRIESTGTGGFGELGGEGSGALARFAVVDSVGSAAGRSIATLDLDASGFGGGGAGGTTAASDAGEAFVIAQVFDVASAVDLASTLTVTSVGTRSPAGPGISIAVGGAPLSVSGDIALTTTRDVTITAAQPLFGFGNIDVVSRTFFETGLTYADLALSVIGTNGITAERLGSGGTTLLQALNGAILVSIDLDSAGAVTALGRSIDITSLGALTVTSAQATAGNLRIATAGNLTSALAQATGTATLTGGGAFVATGPVSGSTVALTGNTGVTAGTVTSAGTTSLQSPNGTVSVTALTSAGAVTAQGRALDLHSPGALSFADAQATAGSMVIDVQGNLALAQGNASGGMTLSSATGAITATGALGSGGNVSIVAPLGVDLSSLTSGGTTLLRATGGTVRAGNLLSTGLVTAFGRSVDLTSTVALSFADLDATAGPLSVIAAGNLGLATVDATGAVTLRSTGGATSAGGAINAGGAVVLAGNTGLTAGTVASGGTTLLQSANGAVAITALTSPGAVTAQGRSLDLHSPGALNIADAQATAGSLLIDTQGNLALAQANATGALTLSSANGAISATGALSGGGNTSVTAPLGVALGSLTSGGTTLLLATGGAITVTNLQSTGAVTAAGRSVDLVSTGALTFADLDATAGALSVQTAGNLTVATADATGAVTLRSTGGAVRSTGSVNGASIALTASGAVQADANLAAAGNLAVDAGGTFTLAGLARGTAIGVRSSDIALGGTATVGVRGQTQDVTLTNSNPARVTFIGGAADPAGYSLDQAELLRIFADRSIVLASAGDVTIRNLALTFGANANIGTGGRLEVTTPARVSITGNVALTTSGANDRFVIDPSRIELTTDTGSIALLSGAGNPLGQLAMTGNTIAVATAGVLGQLGAAPSFAAVIALLDQTGGNPQPLRAGTITLNVVDALLIQNSGLSALYRDRAGFAATGLAITTASSNTQIAINGQILTATGPVTGIDTQTLVTINGAAAAPGGLFNPGSTINGCQIGGLCAPPPGSVPPSDADLVEPLPPDGSAPSLFVAPLIELADTEPLITPPLVDEPITGVGNDDLWEPRCAPGEQGVSCPEEEGQP